MAQKLRLAAALPGEWGQRVVNEAHGKVNMGARFYCALIFLVILILFLLLLRQLMLQGTENVVGHDEQGTGLPMINKARHQECTAAAGR